MTFSKALPRTSTSKSMSWRSSSNKSISVISVIVAFWDSSSLQIENCIQSCSFPSLHHSIFDCTSSWFFVFFVKSFWGCVRFEFEFVSEAPGRSSTPYTCMQLSLHCSKSAEQGRRPRLWPHRTIIRKRSKTELSLLCLLALLGKNDLYLLRMIFVLLTKD